MASGERLICEAVRKEKPPANTTRRGLLMSLVSRGAGRTSDVMAGIWFPQHQLEITNWSSSGDGSTKGNSAFHNKAVDTERCGVRDVDTGAFFVSSGTCWYLWVTGVSLPIVLPYVGTVSVETPEISGQRAIVHAVLFLLCFYFGFISKPKGHKSAG